MPRFTTFRLYLLGLALLFGGYVALEYNRPKPLDWTPTYINKDKIPFGTYALFDQLPRLLGTDSIETVRLPVYSQLTGLSEDDAAPENPTRFREAPADDAEAATDSVATPEAASAPVAEEAGVTDFSLPRPANYLFINADFELSRPDAQALLRFVASGSDAFVTAKYFRSGRGVLRDSLGFDLRDIALPTRLSRRGLPIVDSTTLRFTNPTLAAARLRLPGTEVAQSLVVDSGRVGRTLAVDAQGRPVLIRLDYGRGHFYLCTVPAAFSNYYLLRRGGANFAAAALAYLPARRTWWDEYQKQGPVGEQSLLRVVFGHEALRIAWYLLLLGGLLFVLVEARRRQRIIPTLRPLPNTTLLFTRTVAGLYRQGRSHGPIAEKKIGLFMDYLRTRFQEPSPDFADEAFRERISQKAGVPRERVDALLRLVNFARTAPQVTDAQLLQLSGAINDFKREVRR